MSLQINYLAANEDIHAIASIVSEVLGEMVVACECSTESSIEWTSIRSPAEYEIVNAQLGGCVTAKGAALRFRREEHGRGWVLCPRGGPLIEIIPDQILNGCVRRGRHNLYSARC